MIRFFLGLLTAIFLVGCGKGNDSSSPGTGPGPLPATTPMTISLTVPNPYPITTQSVAIPTTITGQSDGTPIITWAQKVGDPIPVLIQNTSATIALVTFPKNGQYSFTINATDRAGQAAIPLTLVVQVDVSVGTTISGSVEEDDGSPADTQQNVQLLWHRLPSGRQTIGVQSVGGTLSKQFSFDGLLGPLTDFEVVVPPETP